MGEMRFHESWRGLAQRKASDTAARIPAEWRLDGAVLDKARSLVNIADTFIADLMEPAERDITAMTAVELVEKLGNGRLTAETVTRAFCKRAAFAHQLNNCLHEIFFDSALQRARQLDKHFEVSGSPIGPLHGLPVSLKDQFHVQGVETTMGYVGWIGTFEGRKGTGMEGNTDSQVVDELLSLGAVLYCKTSLPQTLLLGETHNNIFGYTMNPVNQQLSCGGSSGGEAALQALGGSSVGFGSDIGGSVRVPSAFCGTFAIKPSTSRLSYRLVANSMPGQTIVSSAIGIMSTALPSLQLMMQAMLSTEPWRRDPEVAPIPWREDQVVAPKTKLCFATLPFDGIVQPHPPIQRGMNMMTLALQAAGHKIIPWAPPSHASGGDIHEAFIGSDGGADIFKQLNFSGEPIIPEKRDEYYDGPVEPLSVVEYQDFCVQRKAYRASYAAYWESTKDLTGTGRPVDALIMPVAPHAAVIPGKYFHYRYSEIINLLDYSSVSLPVTRAEMSIDVPDSEYCPISDADQENWEAYDPTIYHGAPVGVQIVGRGLQEERILSIAQIAFDALEEHKKTQKS